MAKYNVEVVETLSRVVEQEANSYEDAEKLVATRYSDEEIVLDWQDLFDTNYKPYPSQKIKSDFSVQFMYNKSKQELIVSDKSGTINYSCKNFEELEVLLKDYFDDHVELEEVMPEKDIRKKAKEHEK